MMASSRRNTFLAILLLLALGLAAFAPVLGASFLDWDDQMMIVLNPLVAPHAQLELIWSKPYIGLYIPLTYTLYAGIAGVFGMNPFAFHAANLTWHLLGGVIAFSLIAMLVRNRGAAFVGAAVWMLHPIQVEAVAWAASLNTVLCGALSLGSIACYVRFCQATGKHRWAWLTSAMALLGLALLAKPSSAALPLGIIAIDLLILRRPVKSVLLSGSLLLAIAIPFAIVARAAQPATTVAKVPVTDRIIVAANALSHDATKIVWPAPLLIDYGQTPQTVLATDTRWIGLIVTCALILIVAWQARKRPWLVAAAIMFIAGIAPVLGLVHFDFQVFSTVADRFVYVAMLGVAIAIAFAVRDSIHRRGAQLTCAAVLIVLAALAFRRSLDWKTNDTLFSSTLAQNPRSLAAHTTLGYLHARERRVAEAISHYQAALAVSQNHFNTNYNFGNLMLSVQKPREAITLLERARQLNPDRPELLNNLGIAYTMDGQYDRAIFTLYNAIALQPDFAEATTNLGQAFRHNNQPDKAREMFQRALTITPGYPPALRGMAQLDNPQTQPATP